MSVTIQWDNEEKTILRYDMSGFWTWDEFFPAFEQGKQMISEVEHEVSFIVNPLDNQSRNHIPTSVLTHIRSINRNVPPNAGPTVSVSVSNFARALIRTLSYLAPQIAERYFFADSLEQARILLKERTGQEQPAPPKPDANP